MLFLRFLMNPQNLICFTALQAAKQASFSTAYISFELCASPAMALFLSFARPLFLYFYRAALPPVFGKNQVFKDTLRSFDANEFPDHELTSSLIYISSNSGK
ncbi:MAG: hypothetical protein LC633_08840 [Desulfobulbaceae bacterium]|nr:hypothetical protein [Desulfobulbaceae bacterium]